MFKELQSLRVKRKDTDDSKHSNTPCPTAKQSRSNAVERQEAGGRGGDTAAAVEFTSKSHTLSTSRGKPNQDSVVQSDSRSGHGQQGKGDDSHKESVTVTV